MNEILQLKGQRVTLDVPRLPPASSMDCRLFTSPTCTLPGCVGKDYFHEVVRISNDLQPDLVCVTGDIVDRTACLDWIPDTLGRLTARHGVYFILGNHDLRVDVGRLRHMLERAG